MDLWRMMFWANDMTMIVDDDTTRVAVNRSEVDAMNMAVPGKPDPPIGVVWWWSDNGFWMRIL
jgi:hypothetical protein